MSLEFGLIPIAYGSPREGYEALAPYGSFMFAEDFKSGKELAQEMLRIKNDPKMASSYYRWHHQYDNVDCLFTKHGFGNLCKRLFAEDSTGCQSNSMGKPVVADDICYSPYKILPNLRQPFGTCHGPTMVR